VLPGGVVNADELRMVSAAATLVQRPLRVQTQAMAMARTPGGAFPCPGALPVFTVRAQGLYSAPIRATFKALAVPEDVRS